MSRILSVVLICLLVGRLRVGAGVGNQNVQRHVARLWSGGARLEAQFRFQVKNIYEEDLHILGVKSSCGCTTPQITKSDLKTFETAEIVADFNTRDFLGHKSATLTVTLECRSHAKVQLQVTGMIRGDVTLQPGAIDYGVVNFGSAGEKTLQVTYSGREDWRILDAKTADPHFEVEITEFARGPGRVSYQLLVRLTKDAPIGYVKDQLVLVTNDTRAPS